jgi:hypothetical protein
VPGFESGRLGFGSGSGRVGPSSRSEIFGVGMSLVLDRLIDIRRERSDARDLKS